MTANSTVDNATVLLEFVVHLSSQATDGSSLTVGIKVDSQGTTVDTQDQTIVAKTNVPSTNTPVS